MEGARLLHPSCGMSTLTAGSMGRSHHAPFLCPLILRVVQMYSHKTMCGLQVAGEAGRERDVVCSGQSGRLQLRPQDRPDNPCADRSTLHSFRGVSIVSTWFNNTCRPSPRRNVGRPCCNV